MKKIAKITVKKEQDDFVDFSVYQQEYEDETPKNREKYKEQDRQRIANYGVTWWTINVYAMAEIDVNNGNLPAEYTQTHRIKSGGILLESDYEQSDIESYQKEELADLKATLKELGFTDAEIDSVPVEYEDEA